MFTTKKSINIPELLQDFLVQIQWIGEASFSMYYFPIVHASFKMESFCTRYKISREYSVTFNENCTTKWYPTIIHSFADSLKTLNLVLEEGNGITLTINVDECGSEYCIVHEITKENIDIYNDWIERCLTQYSS